MAKAKELGQYFIEVINALFSVVEEYDASVKTNSERTAKISKEFCRVLKVISKKDQVDGKVLVDNILEVHNDFGNVLLQRWGFAKIFSVVAKKHDDSKFFKSSPKELLIVNLANQISQKNGFNFSESQEIELADLESAKLLNLDPDEIAKIEKHVIKSMGSTANIF